MGDIVERLVRFAGKVCISTDTEVEAAATIEALRAENARLREALKPFADCEVWDGYKDEETFVSGLKIGDLRAAREAMGETE